MLNNFWAQPRRINTLCTYCKYSKCSQPWYCEWKTLFCVFYISRVNGIFFNYMTS